MEVESSGHAWLDGCNFQQKQLLAPNEYLQRHPLCTEDSGAAEENLNDLGNLHKWRRNDFTFFIKLSF